MLGDIPVVGNLFKCRQLQQTKRTLFVYLRPTILRDRASVVAAAEAKYARLRPRRRAIRRAPCCCIHRRRVCSWKSRGSTSATSDSGRDSVGVHGRRGLKIATYNVNGVNGRLANVIAWLGRAAPDVVCLQELKAPDNRFPAAAFEAAGYGAVWHGQSRWNGVAILARGTTPVLTRRGLPDDPAPDQSRYIEAAVGGVLIGCLYLPNGNPWPGPKFDYKLAWFAAFAAHATSLLASGLPVVLAGDYNVVPTDFDIYRPGALKGNALIQPEPRAAYEVLVASGWTDALRTLHPAQPMFTFWGYFRRAFDRDAGMRLDHLLLGPDLAARLTGAGVDREARATLGSSDHAPAWIALKP